MSVTLTPMGTATVPQDEVKRVKALGCLHCKGTDLFNCRVITKNGKVSADTMQHIIDAAKQFGNGEVCMTTRLTVEIQQVPFEKIDAMRAYLAQFGLETGGTGRRVRPVVSCKGTTCQYGLLDTYGLSEEIHDRFFVGYRDVVLPHKFKIAVGGCPNNCVKPNLNDVGIFGQRIPELDAEKCRGCKKCQCAVACPVHAVSVVDGKMYADPEICTNCGRCVGKCPFHARDNSTYGFRMYVGGRWGKQVSHGILLDKVFTSKDEVLETVEKCILLFRDQGIPGERFAQTIQRIGFDNVQQQLMSDALLERKAEILAD